VVRGVNMLASNSRASSDIRTLFSIGRKFISEPGIVFQVTVTVPVKKGTPLKDELFFVAFLDTFFFPLQLGWITLMVRGRGKYQCGHVGLVWIRT